MFGELHAHMIMDGKNYKAAVALHEGGVQDRYIRQHLQESFDAGIRLIRDGGDAKGVSKRAKELSSEYGITYLTPIFAIHKKGHYGGIVGHGFEDFDGYKKLVRRAIEEGADFIKIMISGIMNFDTFHSLSEDGLTDTEICDMISYAHECGMSVMAHSNGSRIVSAAIKAGVDSVEHGNYLEDEVLHQLAESSAVWVPTFAPIGNLIGCGRFPDEQVEKILDAQLSNVSAAASYGAHIGLGSDAGAYLVPHGKGLLDEYDYMSRAIPDKEKRDSMLTEAEALIMDSFSRRSK